MPDLDKKVEEAREILMYARDEHEVKHWRLLFSGGNDSAVSTHLARRVLGPEASVVHIDTGTGFPCVRKHVLSTAKKFAWRLRIIGPGDHTGQRFSEWVKENGMPGPTGHSYVYVHLKQRAIEQIQREAKDGWHDRVAFVTGVYLAESNRRAQIHTGITDTKGCRVMVNPCLNWKPMHFHKYRKRHSIEQNPVTEVLGKSGECLCGAFAKKGELARIAIVNEDVAERLKEIEAEAKGPWGYEDAGPPKTWQLEKHGQQRLHLCTDCKA